MNSKQAPRTESGLLRGIDIERAYNYTTKQAAGPLRLYISYDAVDQHFKDALGKHLQPLKTAGKIELWSKDATPAGSYWQDELTAELLRADAAVVLMSANLFASRIFTDIETPMLIRRRSQSGMPIIPLLVRSCSWDTDSWLRGLKILPADGKPVASLHGDDADRAFLEVTRTVDSLVTEGGRPSQDARTFFELYGRQQHLILAKTSEAKHMIAAMARGLVQYAMREDEHGRPRGLFPPSGPLVPARVPRGTKYLAEERDWDHPAWQAIRFCLPGVLYFSYDFVTASDGRTSTARAHGDILGDGRTVVHERQVTIDAYGHATISPETVTRENFG